MMCWSGDFVLTFREVVQSSAEEKDGFCEVDIERGKLRDLLKVHSPSEVHLLR